MGLRSEDGGKEVFFIKLTLNIFCSFSCFSFDQHFSLL